MFYVDGTDIGDTRTRLRCQSVAFEFVDEVQVKPPATRPNSAVAMGGVVNVITRQGGNAFHGDLLGYLQRLRVERQGTGHAPPTPYDINMAEYVNYQDLYGKDKIDRIEGGFSLGGYVFKDKLWFSGSFLPVFQHDERHVVDPSTLEEDYTRRDQSWNFQAKLTAQPFKFMRLGASYINNSNKYKGALPNRNGTSDPTAFWPDYGFAFPSWSPSAYTDLTLGNNLLFSFRGGTYYTNITDQQVQPQASLLHIRDGSLDLS